jgi:hypothetical protein
MQTGRHYPEADCPIFNAFRQGLPCRIDDEVLWRADGSPSTPSTPATRSSRRPGAGRGGHLRRHHRAQAQARPAAPHQRELEQRTVPSARANCASWPTTWRRCARRAHPHRREIHDELGSLLVALKMDVHWLGRGWTTATSWQCKCQGMGRLIDTAVDNVGRIITDLRPSILDHQGLWAALEWQAQEFIDSAELGQRGLQLHVAPACRRPRAAGDRCVPHLSGDAVQRGTPCPRAACRSGIAVDDPPHPVLYLDVRDDGVGAEPQALGDPRSYGVMGMRERAGTSAAS